MKKTCLKGGLWWKPYPSCWLSSRHTGLSITMGFAYTYWCFVSYIGGDVVPALLPAHESKQHLALPRPVAGNDGRAARGARLRRVPHATQNSQLNNLLAFILVSTWQNLAMPRPAGCWRWFRHYYTRCVFRVPQCGLIDPGWDEQQGRVGAHGIR